LAAIAVSLKGLYYHRRPSALPVGSEAVPEFEMH